MRMISEIRMILEMKSSHQMGRKTNESRSTMAKGAALNFVKKLLINK